MNAGFAIGWRQVAVCFVMLASIAMVAAAYSVVAVPLEKEFAVSRKVLLLAMTVSSLGSAILSPLIGLIYDLTGSYSGILYTFAGLALLVTLMVPYLRLHPRGEAG